VSGLGDWVRLWGRGSANNAESETVTESARGLDPGLLERDELIAALDVRIASMRSGSGGTFVWIGGEAGVGKTALLRLFCERQIKPVRVLWGV
jgi:MoxR-like ATPase